MLHHLEYGDKNIILVGTAHVSRESEQQVQEIIQAEQPDTVKVYTREARAQIDDDLTDMTIEFMKKNAKGDKPFFAYVPYTLPHIPAIPSEDFEGKTGNGRWADMPSKFECGIHLSPDGGLVRSS